MDVAGRSIGVFNVHGDFYAVRNVCPHQMAPLCLGKVTGTTLPSRPGEFNWGKDGQILRCPWHAWEFDLTTGQSVFNPHKVRVKRYDVAVEVDDADDQKPQCDGADQCAPSVTEPGTPDPELETYDVQVEQRMVVLYV